jgi:hypothetical protein
VTENSTRPCRGSLVPADELRETGVDLGFRSRAGRLDGGQRGGGDGLHDVLADGRDQFVAVGEALVEVAGGQPRLLARPAHGELIALAPAKQVQPGPYYAGPSLCHAIGAGPSGHRHDTGNDRLIQQRGSRR